MARGTARNEREIKTKGEGNELKSIVTIPYNLA